MAVEGNSVPRGGTQGAVTRTGIDAQTLIDEMGKWVGQPYVWGGDGPGGFDCSGLVDYSLRQLGIDIGRTTYDQWNYLKQHGDQVQMNQLQPGDLIYENFPGEQPPGHVVVYVGHGQVLQAAHQGTKVSLTPLNEGGGMQIVGIARVPGVTYTGTPIDISGLSSAVTQSGGSVATPEASGRGARTTSTVGSMSTAQTAALGAHVERVLSATPYSGKGAYKGFDMSGLPADLRGQARQAIDTFTANPALERQIFAEAYQNYGADLWMASDSQIRTLLVVGAINGYALDPNMFQSLLQNTNWWRTHDANQRNFADLIHSQGGVNSASVQQLVNQAQARVTNVANSLGVQLSAGQLKNMAWRVASESATPQGQFSATAFSDQEIYKMVASAFRATTFMGTASGTPAPGSAATGATGGGDAAALFNQFKTIARDYYLPMNDQQIANQVQRYIRGDTGAGNFESGAIAGFTTFAEQQAKGLYPALGSVLGTTSSVGTANTPYAAMSNYRSLIAQYTGYQGDPDTIDLTNPQWSWILSGKAPPNSATATAGTPAPSSSTTAANTPPALPTYDAVQSYLMQQPQFGKTDLGKKMGWDAASAITKAFGFN